MFKIIHAGISYIKWIPKTSANKWYNLERGKMKKVLAKNINDEGSEYIEDLKWRKYSSILRNV